MGKEKTILVTGVAGFIGSHVTQELLQQGYKVVGIDNLNDFYELEVKKSNLESFISNVNFKFLEFDLCNKQKLEEIFSNNSFEQVVHLAARAGVRPSLENPTSYVESNITATLNLLEACKNHKVTKFILASSSSVYGDSAHKIPFEEEQDCSKPISPYAATKKACEELCYTYHHLYGINIIALRFFTVYGPRQRPDLAIHKFAKLIHSGQPIMMFGDGSTSRDYTYVTDTLQGVMAAVKNTDIKYEIINLGGAKTTTLARLIELLEQNLNKKTNIQQMPTQPGDVPLTYACTSKAKKLLSYEPKVSIEEGIEKFCKWFLKAYN
jgi:UDP-glucuronate 4-epimerase